MATYTENYNLIKPDLEDYYDIANQNNNMDTIDQELAKNSTDISGVNKKMDTAQKTLDSISSAIGTPPVGSTLTSMIAGGRSVIRSVQRVVYKSTLPQQKNGTVQIQSVNPAKTIVFSERLVNGFNYTMGYDYTLHQDHIAVTHDEASPDYLKIGFWVLEFI